MAAPELLAPLNRVKEPFAVNLLAQAAGIAALEDDECLKASVAANQVGRIYLYCEFGRLGLFYVKSHANFVLVRIGPNAGQVIQMLLEQGVIVRSCNGYDLPEFTRVTVGSPEQNARLIKALEGVLLSISAAR